MNAADRIRQAIEALPEEQRRPWRIEGGDMVIGDGVIMVEEDYVPCGIAAYIALMDPTVGAALADLLDAFDARHALPGTYAYLSDHEFATRITAEEQAESRIWAARDALEQAIERRSGND